MRFKEGVLCGFVRKEVRLLRRVYVKYFMLFQLSFCVLLLDITAM